MGNVVFPPKLALCWRWKHKIVFHSRHIMCFVQWIYELFQLQMRLSFPLLLDNNFKPYLLLIRTRSFYTFIYVGRTYACLAYSQYKYNFYTTSVLKELFLCKSPNRNKNIHTQRNLTDTTDATKETEATFLTDAIPLSQATPLKPVTYTHLTLPHNRAVNI